MLTICTINEHYTNIKKRKSDYSLSVCSVKTASKNSHSSDIPDPLKPFFRLFSDC
jgi:hypothetical protein